MSATQRHVVGVADLRKRVGEIRTIDTEVSLDEAVGTGAAIDGPVHVALSLESIPGGIEAIGVVTGRSVGACRRCLQPVEAPLRTEVRELFVDERRAGTFDEDEPYPIVDDEIDLVPLVREAALLALPLAPLCRAECAGPAPEDFPTGPVRDDPRPDPRWAALDELRFDS